MIDTITLSIPKERVTDQQGVSMWNLQARTKMYDKFIKNPSAKELASGLYFPYITGYRRKNKKLEWDSTIRIQFSAPKLIYLNNLDELSEKQFSEVLNVLHDRLKRMGIIISLSDLENAAVVSVHYSKNIVLKNGYTAQYIIGQLGKINLNKQFDFARARFMNDGESLMAHTTTHEFVVYDKISDLNKGTKRSLDRDQTAYQLSLFGRLKEEEEIIRFEVRLAQKRKINSLFKQLGFSENPTFRDVFSIKKSKKIVMHYWNTMIEKNSLLLFAHTLTPKDTLNQVLMVHKTAKAKSAIYMAGLLLLAPDGNGMRELRAILSKRNRDRTWYRICSDLDRITKKFSKLKQRGWYEQIKNSFNSYEPYRVIDG